MHKGVSGIKKITVVGGGNIGTQFACVCAEKGYEVCVFSSKAEKYDGSLMIVDADNKVISEGKIAKVTSTLSEALSDCDVVFVTLPSFMFPKFAQDIRPYVTEKLHIGIIPGTGGAEFAFRNCIDAGAKLFGIQRVPCVARLVEYGKCVRVEGKREKLHLAAIPKSATDMLAEFLSFLFDMPCESLPNYLCVTMTPSNPILHTTRLCTMFADYAPGVIYERNPLFYGEWSEDSAELLLACDAEHQRLLAKLTQLDLTGVRSLREHYESDTVQQLTNKLRSIESLHNLSSPMVQEEGGWIPDFNSRYFTADFPYGLAIIEQLAKIIGMDTPNISKTMAWYRRVSGDENCLDLGNYGIRTIEDIYRLYR